MYPSSEPELRDLPLTVDLILSWADLYHSRHDRWPTARAGRTPGVRGEKWQNVDNALRLGLRGLPGGSSLAVLLTKRRGARNRTSTPKLTMRQILLWAKAYRERMGKWPQLESGPVLGVPGETWATINAALVGGLRGLPGGDTLGRLLARKLKLRNQTKVPRLTKRKILAWADAINAALPASKDWAGVTLRNAFNSAMVHTPQGNFRAPGPIRSSAVLRNY